jgi:hypothetical protein
MTMSGSLFGRGARCLGLALASAAALASASPAAAGMPARDDDANAIFSLQRARREQQRDATAAAPYRSNLPWPAAAAAAAADGAPRRWAIATAGPEFDEQPILLSNGIGTLDEMARDSHGAGVWFADVGSELFRSGAWSGGLAGSYWGAAYSDVDFDTNYPTVASFVDWSFGETAALRLRYDFGYSWVDLDSFATTHHVGPRIYKDWGRGGASEFRAEYYSYDFHLGLPDFPTKEIGAPRGFCRPLDDPLPHACGPFQKSGGDRRDRSGWGFIVSGEHRVDLDFNDTEIRGGYTYQHYIPEGAEFHNQSHEIWLAVTTALPFGFLLDTNLTFLYQGNRNEPSIPDPDTLVPNRIYSLLGYRRHDRIWRWYTAIGRAITPNVSASMEYGFTDHDSNFQAFDYARHRIGGYVTVHFE